MWCGIELGSLPPIPNRLTITIKHVGLNKTERTVSLCSCILTIMIWNILNFSLNPQYYFSLFKNSFNTHLCMRAVQATLKEMSEPLWVQFPETGNSSACYHLQIHSPERKCMRLELIDTFNRWNKLHSIWNTSIRKVNCFSSRDDTRRTIWPGQILKK